MGSSMGIQWGGDGGPKRAGSGLGGESSKTLPFWLEGLQGLGRGRSLGGGEEAAWNQGDIHDGEGEKEMSGKAGDTLERCLRAKQRSLNLVIEGQSCYSGPGRLRLSLGSLDLSRTEKSQL